MNKLNVPTSTRVLSQKATAHKLSKHPCTPRRWSSDPQYAHLNFPKPIQLADGSVGYIESEIDAWIASRPRVGASDRAA